MLNRKSISYYLGSILFFFMVCNISQADGLPPLTHSLTSIDTTSKAPELRLPNLNEDMVDIRDLKGKVVVINFWATWCPPCRREMGSLERLYQATKDKGIEVLAVNIGEDMDTVFSFLGMIDPSPSFQMLLDSGGDSLSQWEVKGLPTTFIIKPDGTLAYRAVGGREFDHPDILQKINKLGLQ